MKQIAISLSLCLTCCLLLPGLAAAQEADRAKTLELIRIIELERVFDKQLEMLVPALVDMMKGEHSTLPDRAVDIIFEEVQTLIDEMKPQLMDGFAQIYEQHFTPEEIEALVEVYQTPVMQKCLREQIALMEEAAAMVNSVLDQGLGPYLDRVDKRIQQEFPDGFPEDGQEG